MMCLQLPLTLCVPTATEPCLDWVTLAKVSAATPSEALSFEEEWREASMG